MFLKLLNVVVTVSSKLSRNFYKILTKILLSIFPKSTIKFFTIHDVKFFKNIFNFSVFYIKFFQDNCLKKITKESEINLTF